MLYFRGSGEKHPRPSGILSKGVEASSPRCQTNTSQHHVPALPSRVPLLAESWRDHRPYRREDKAQRGELSLRTQRDAMGGIMGWVLARSSGGREKVLEYWMSAGP